MDKKIGKLQTSQERQQYRKEIVTKYQESELPQREFAKIHGIGYSTLQKWLREAREDSTHASVEPIPDCKRGLIEAGILESEPTRSAAEIEVALSDGTCLCFGSQLSTDKIVQIIQSLRKSCSH